MIAMSLATKKYSQYFAHDKRYNLLDIGKISIKLSCKSVNFQYIKRRISILFLEVSSEKATSKVQ